MGRKYHSYIREWRIHCGLTQDQLLDRLQEVAASRPPTEASTIPLTAGSLSRIENGKQNFSMATLTALAEVLGAEEPGWLLDRDPRKGAEVISIVGRLNEQDRARAAAVLEAMFPASGEDAQSANGNGAA